MNPSDLSILQAIHQLRVEYLHPAANLLTHLGDKEVLVVAGILALFGFLRWGQRKTAFLWVACLVLAMVSAEGTKRLVNRERPAPAFVEVITGAHFPDSPAFPSGHATMAMAFYPMLALLWPGPFVKRHRWGFVALGILLGVFVGLTRLYIGVHWPSDVLVGWLIGGFWATIAWKWENYQGMVASPLPLSQPLSTGLVEEKRS